MKRSHIFFSAIFALIMLIGLNPETGLAQGHYISHKGLHIGIEGKVINNKTRKPVGNATVKLVGTNQKAKTDSTGTFRIANIGKGHKKLKITAKGYEEEIKRINRGKDMNLYITIRLFPKGKKEKNNG